MIDWHSVVEEFRYKKSCVLWIMVVRGGGGEEEEVVDEEEEEDGRVVRISL